MSYLLKAMLKQFGYRLCSFNNQGNSYTAGGGMQNLSSACSYCHSSVRQHTSPHSSPQPLPRGERLHWAHRVPSSRSPEMSYLSTPSQLKNQTTYVQPLLKLKAVFRSLSNNLFKLEKKKNIGVIVLLSMSVLTVTVSGEADPDVVNLSRVEVPDEFHLRSAVHGHQLCIG